MKIVFGFVILMTFVNASYADDMNKALGDMCQKLKTCSLEKMAESQQLSPEMKKQMEAMFEGTCANIENTYKNSIAAFPEHYKLGLACVRSMAKASCKKLMDSDQKSKECKEYEKLVP